MGKGSKAIGEVIDAASISLDNLFPGRAVARPTPSYQFRAFVGSQAFGGSHVLTPISLVVSSPSGACPARTVLRLAAKQSSVTYKPGAQLSLPPKRPLSETIVAHTIKLL